MTDKAVVRARFAPSPTGYLHVGGARTALFNWLYCRRHGGRFVLRIEDTDHQRNVADAEHRLMEDLRWLGLDWDEGPDIGGEYGPYRQSERLDLYRQELDRLLEEGKAYYAFDTPEELNRLRGQAIADKRSWRYPRPAEPHGAAQVEQARAEGRPVVVRFKAPNEAVTVQDEILGKVSFGAGEVDDLVLMKSNGWPTYHFAVVVDDARMKISHVLRAQEHLMNTPKHVLLQQALGYATPDYAHLPLVFNLDGSKMSKRDKNKFVRRAAADSMDKRNWTLERLTEISGAGLGSVERWLGGADSELDVQQVTRIASAAGVVMPEVDVNDFRVSGYLPEALVNFVALIGWSPGNDQEKMTREEMVQAFSLDRINKTSGRFDRDRLLAFSTDYFTSEDPERVAAAFDDYLQLNDTPVGRAAAAERRRLIQVAPGFRTFKNLDRKSRFLYVDDDQIELDQRACKKVLHKGRPSGLERLTELLPVLEAVEDWSAASLEALIKQQADEHAAGKLGKLAQPVRVALTGTTVSPPIFESLDMLGKERSLARIRRCLELAKSD